MRGLRLVTARRFAAVVVETQPTDHAGTGGAFNGLYFVLLGRLSPLDGVGPGQIHLEKLVNQRHRRHGQEVILATNFTNEGEVTAHVIAELLEAGASKVSHGGARNSDWRRAGVCGCGDCGAQAVREAVVLQLECLSNK